jgi:hypothetical protein
MNHDEGEGGLKAWLPMIFCCVVMISVFVLLGAGLLSLR